MKVAVTDKPISAQDFGCREGHFPIDRVVWERELIRLFSAYAPDRDNEERSHGAFENDTFRVIPYIWHGECECGFEQQAERWHEDHPHLPTCYDTVRAAAIEDWKRESGIEVLYEASMCDIFTEKRDGFTTLSTSSRSEKAEAAYEKWCALQDEQDQFEQQLSRRLCREMKIPWNKDSAVHCTCGKDDRAKLWFSTLGHREPCPLWKMGLPNFLHKPSGYAVTWYKYPCRGGDANQLMSPKGFTAIIDSGIASLAK